MAALPHSFLCSCGNEPAGFFIVFVDSSGVKMFNFNKKLPILAKNAILYANSAIYNGTGRWYNAFVLNRWRNSAGNLPPEKKMRTFQEEQ